MRNQVDQDVDVDGGCRRRFKSIQVFKSTKMSEFKDHSVVLIILKYILLHVLVSFFFTCKGLNIRGTHARFFFSPSHTGPRRRL